MGLKKAMKQILIKRQDQRYERQLAERRISYHRFVTEKEQKEGVLPEKKLDGADFVIWRQKRGCLAEHAIEQLEAYFAEHPEVDVVYGDEDRVTAEGERQEPWYKPCWSPDTYRSFFYLGSVIAVRKRLLQAFSQETGKAPMTGTSQEVVFESAEALRSWMDALLYQAGGFRKGCHRIGHVEKMLFHVKDERVWEEYQSAGESGELAERFAVMEAGETSARPAISVIIPTRDHPEILETCLKTLLDSRQKDRKLEIIVVDNGSSEPNRQKLEEMTKGMRYLYEPAEFNFSAMCNRGAEVAQGEVLLFLNDDMELCADGWMEEMAERASLPYVGAVGLKLYYPDSNRIQHDGIVNLPVGPVHKLQYMEDDRSYYFGRNRFTCNCVAVTAACLMVEAAKFREAGGFQPKLRVAYNDVELGFRLLELGYQNVVINDYFAYHHESLSRGSDESPEKLQRLEGERELLYRLHPQFRGEDPYYPVGLNREGLDSRMVPGYVTAKNRIQDPHWKKMPYSLEKLHRDACLMARVETAGPERIQGYSVILGDDNACYEKYLLLLPREEQEPRLYMRVQGQYRQDLEQNLPDQVNVALGGFCVNRQGEALKKGTYGIAVLAVNRVTGLRIWNETGKFLVVK